MNRWLPLVVVLAGLAGGLWPSPGAAAAGDDAVARGEAAVGGGGAARGADEEAESLPVRRFLPVASAQYWLFPVSARLGEQATVESSGNLRLSAAVGAPIEALDTVLVGMAQYDWTSLLFAHEEEEPERREFHGVFLRVAASIGLVPRWRLNLVGSAGLASDFASVHGDDLRMTVGASASYRHSPDLQIRFGVMYSSAFYTPIVIPLLAVNYRHAPWHLRFMVPRGGALWYEISEDLQVGLHLRIVNLRYQSHAASSGFDELTLLNCPLGLSVLRFLWSGLYVLLEGGYSFQFARLVTGEATRSRKVWGGWQVSLGLGFML